MVSSAVWLGSNETDDPPKFDEQKKQFDLPKESKKDIEKRKKEEKKAAKEKKKNEELYPQSLKDYVNRQLLGYKIEDEERKNIRGSVCKHLVRIVGGKQAPEFWEKFCTSGNIDSKKKVKAAFEAAKDERDAPEPGFIK